MALMPSVGWGLYTNHAHFNQSFLCCGVLAKMVPRIINEGMPISNSSLECFSEPLLT